MYIKTDIGMGSKMAKVRPMTSKMRPKMVRMRPKMATVLSEMTKMRSKISKMRPKIAKMKPKMAKMKPKIAARAIFEGPLTQNSHVIHAQACIHSRTARGDHHRGNGETTAGRHCKWRGLPEAALSRIRAGLRVNTKHHNQLLQRPGQGPGELY